MHFSQLSSLAAPLGAHPFPPLILMAQAAPFLCWVPLRSPEVHKMAQGACDRAFPGRLQWWLVLVVPVMQRSLPQEKLAG